MRVEGGAARLCPALLRPQQLAQLGALGGVPVIVVVEGLRDGTPSGPAGQDRLLLDVSPPASVVAAPVQNGKRVEVRSQLGGDAGRGQVVLGRGTERSGARRRARLVYSGALIAWLISASVR